jgi:hypothetical protein
LASIPAVHALERRFEGRGLRLIGVTQAGETEEEKKDVERVAKEHHMTQPTYLDIDGAFAQASGLGNNPSFLIIGKDGRSVYRLAGKLTEGTEDFNLLASAIEQAIAKK